MKRQPELPTLLSDLTDLTPQQVEQLVRRNKQRAEVMRRIADLERLAAERLRRR